MKAFTIFLSLIFLFAIEGFSQWEYVRTPDTRFEQLSDYNFKPNYKVIDGLRMHYIDEGHKDSSVVVFLHGEPSWSYLYRDMIKRMVQSGFRVIAPDLVGFGRSDKLAKLQDYTYARQVEWTKTLLLDSLKLTNINIFLQDWGGLIGLRIITENPSYFSKIAVANTALPTGDSIFVVGDDFKQWQNFALNSTNFDIGQFIQRSTERELTTQEVAAYNAPFPSEEYKKGARQMPQLVPTRADDPASEANRKAWSVLSKLKTPFLTLYSDKNTVGQEFEKYFQDIVPGAKGQPHKLLKNGGHFLQEDNGTEICTILKDWYKGKNTPGQDPIIVTDTLKKYAQTFPPMPRGTADLIPFTQGMPTFASGGPFNDLDFTILDTDYMDGENSGGDIFMPVDPSDTYPGANKVKYIKCVLNTDLDLNYQSAKADRIILGTAEIPHPFFSRGADGIDNDYCVIQHLDFNSGYIQLRGQASDYSLVYCTKEEGCKTTGWYLFYTANNNIDLVAFIFPCWDIEPAVSGNPPKNPNPICNSDSLMSLTNPVFFKYAQPISSTPAIPEAIAQFGSNGKEVIGGMTMDNTGNNYFFGCTDGNLDGKTDAPNEIFVAKVSTSGQRLWATELSMGEGTILKGGVCDNEFIYVAGRTLGNLPGFTNAGRWDGILLKLNLSDGQIVATNQWGNPGIDGYGNITQDDAGNIFVSAQGSPDGQATTDDVYLVAKHQKSDLKNVWRALNAPNTTGFMASSEAWGGLTYVPGGTPGVGRLIAGGWYFGPQGANAFVSVYEDLHTTAPTRPHSVIINTQGTRADWVLDSKVDKQGNIYVAGFTTGNLQGTHLGEGDAYIIKYSPQLTNPITKQFGTNKSDLVRKLAIDSNNNLYAVGYTYGNYDGHTNSDPTLRTADVFVQKFDQNLNFLDSKQFGSPNEERGYCYLKDDILFIGGITEGSVKSSNLGSFDGFILALNTRDLSYNLNPVLSVSIPEMREPIKFYPNPTSDLVTFDFDNTNIYDFVITNQLGQQIKTGKLDHNRKTVSLGEFSKGIYLINLKNKQTNSTIKVVKR